MATPTVFAGFRIPPELHEWLKQKAKEEDRTMNKMLTVLLRKLMAAEQGEDSKK